MKKIDMSGGAPLLAGLSAFVAILLMRARFHFVPTAQGPWRGMADAPGLRQWLAATVVGICVAAWLWRRPTALATPFFLLLLAAAPLLPLLTGWGVLALALQ